MSYEPTNWKTGDVITAEKLNKIESRIANTTPDIITFQLTYDQTTDNICIICDHTDAELHAILNNCF